MKTNHILQYILACAMVCMASLIGASAEIRLPAFITDNMVVQRNSSLTLRGTATPGSTVVITPGWGTKTIKAKAGTDGTFTATVNTPEAGGPYCLTLSDGKDELTLNNILSGEVWLCSGQSNMEFPVNGWTNVMGYDTLIPTAQHPDIRLLQITKQTAMKPQSDCRTNMGGWVECTPATVPEFSAVAYLYARELAEKLHVPVGVIDATWGGTPAEAWTSFDGVKNIDGFEQEAAALERCDFDATRLQDDYEKRLSDWMALAEKQQPAEGTETQSGLMPTGTNWENTVLPASFDGIVWVSKTIEIPEAAAGKPMTLHLGAIDDEDITYFNGSEIARGSGYDTPRIYTVPAEMVKAGNAEIKIRISDFGGGGGFNGGDKMTAEAGGVSIPLDGDWNYNVAVDFAKLPAKPVSVTGSSYPTVLYNAMIHPLSVMPVKGVIWYQGCANVGRDRQYEPLFQTLITDWRKLWNNQEMPFYFVQLAGYLKPSYCQPDSEWAALRNAQAKALKLPHTGMATAIDLGNPADIHPRNKQDVAHRLALLAMAQDYGQDVTCRAPALSKAESNGDRIILTFDGELKPTSAAITGFIISDGKGNFAPACGRLTGERTIELSSPKVPRPTVVRYNWADYPGGNLYGTTGLPVAPFATDK